MRQSPVHVRGEWKTPVRVGDSKAIFHVKKMIRKSGSGRGAEHPAVTTFDTYKHACRCGCTVRTAAHPASPASLAPSTLIMPAAL